MVIQVCLNNYNVTYALIFRCEIYYPVLLYFPYFPVMYLLLALWLLCQYINNKIIIIIIIIIIQS